MSHTPEHSWNSAEGTSSLEQASLSPLLIHMRSELGTTPFRKRQNTSLPGADSGAEEQHSPKCSKYMGKGQMTRARLCRAAAAAGAHPVAPTSQCHQPSTRLLAQPWLDPEPLAEPRARVPATPGLRAEKHAHAVGCTCGKEPARAPRRCAGRLQRLRVQPEPEVTTGAELGRRFCASVRSPELPFSLSFHSFRTGAVPVSKTQSQNLVFKQTLEIFQLPKEIFNLLHFPCF